MKQCAFCPAQSVKLSAEHVWGDWMSELFGNRGIAQEHRFGERLTQWESLRMDLTANVVCKKCNETWMSDIEAQMKASFLQIMRDGASVSILHRGVRLLAAFAFEKAVVADYLHLKEDPFFRSSHRHRLKMTVFYTAGAAAALTARESFSN